MDGLQSDAVHSVFIAAYDLAQEQRYIYIAKTMDEKTSGDRGPAARAHQVTNCCGSPHAAAQCDWQHSAWYGQLGGPSSHRRTTTGWAHAT